MKHTLLTVLAFIIMLTTGCQKDNTTQPETTISSTTTTNYPISPSHPANVTLIPISISELSSWYLYVNIKDGSNSVSMPRLAINDTLKLFCTTDTLILLFQASNVDPIIKNYDIQANFNVYKGSSFQKIIYENSGTLTPYINTWSDTLIIK